MNLPPIMMERERCFPVHFWRDNSENQTKLSHPPQNMERQSCFPVHLWTEYNENQKNYSFNHEASVVWDSTKNAKKVIRKRKNKIEKKLSNYKTRDYGVTRRRRNLTFGDPDQSFDLPVLADLLTCRINFTTPRQPSPPRFKV